MSSRSCRANPLASGSPTPSEQCESYLVERPSCLAEGPGPVACGLDSDRGCASQRSMATSAESNRWRPSRRSSASRISGQGVSLRSPARDASATRVIFSTVGPKKRSTARSAAPRPPSLWGFSWDRGGERPGCRVWERLPADDEIRLRVVRSTSHAPSLREATQEHEPPLTGCDCPGIGRRRSRMIRPQSPPVVRQCVGLVTPATTRARAEFEPYPAVAESLHRIVADRPISKALRSGPYQVAVALSPSVVRLGISTVEGCEGLLFVSGDDHSGHVTEISEHMLDVPRQHG